MLPSTILAHYLKDLSIFFLLICRKSLYILDKSVLLHLYIVDIFSQTVACFSFS